MDTEEITQRRHEVVERFGPWTAHNIRLRDDLYTIGPRVVGDEIKLRRITQIVSDIAGKPLADLRVLDLGSLEGLYAIELARHGARAVAVEIREANIAKMRFAKDALSLDNFEIIRDDVRNVSVDKYGYFDIVLCLGLLYHLDAPDVFHFAERVAEICRIATVFDTHVSLVDELSHQYKGDTYWGMNFLEHRNEETDEEKEKKLWSSADNPKSFWLTKPSLNNLLSRVGFTSTYECHNPPEINKPDDRMTLVAFKGRRVELLSAPLMSERAEERWPEKPRNDDTTKPRNDDTTLRRLGRRIVNKLLK